jgi:hypothetical protein
MIEERAAGGRPRAVFWLVSLTLFGVGAWLRLHAISGQIVADDEIHSLAVAGRGSAWWIATHFFRADVSTPLALLQLAIGRGPGLSEVTARLPVLVAGGVALVALPLLARREAGSAVALAFLGLLAISPQLVFYSRFGRPYMASTLLVGLGFFACLRWWRSGSRGGSWAYVLCSALAGWFSLPALPAALTPLAVAGLLAATGSRRAPRSGLRGVVHVGLALAALLAVLLLPPALTSAAAIADKVGAGPPGATTLGNVLLLDAGTGHPVLAAIFWALVVLGAILGTRRRPLLVALAVASILVEIAAIALVAPAWANLAPVAARYASCVLPWVLLLQAFALAEPARRERSGGLVATGGAAWLALLLALGPLPVSYGQTNNLTNHPAYEFRYRAPLPTSYPTIPRFYCLIGRDPERFAIVETPWYTEWFSNFFALGPAVRLLALRTPLRLPALRRSRRPRRAVGPRRPLRGGAQGPAARDVERPGPLHRTALRHGRPAGGAPGALPPLARLRGRAPRGLPDRREAPAALERSRLPPARADQRFTEAMMAGA